MARYKIQDFDKNSIEHELQEKRIRLAGIAIISMSYWQALWWALTRKSKYMTFKYWEETPND